MSGLSTAITTLNDIPRVHAATRADALALQFEGRTSSFAELDRQVTSAATALSDLGVRPGTRIAGFKTPKTVDFISALPRNAAAKILRRELRAPHWQGKERQVN